MHEGGWQGVLEHRVVVVGVETELEALGSSNRITGHVLSSAGTRSGVMIVL